VRKTPAWLPISAAIMAVAITLTMAALSGCGPNAAAGVTAATTASSVTVTTSATTTVATKTSLPAAADFSGVTLDGLAVSLSEYRGKPLVLAFMASW